VFTSPPQNPNPISSIHLAKSSLSSHIRQNFEFTSEKSVFVSIAILILFGKSPIHTSELRLFGEGQIDRKKRGKTHHLRLLTMGASISD